MGTILHKVMECLANGKKCVQDGTKCFQDDALGNIPINEGRLFNPQLVEWLFEQSFAYYTAPNKSIHQYTPRDKKDIWKWCCHTLEYMDGAFDPRRRNIVAAEPHFDFPIEEPWAKYDYITPQGERLSGQLCLKGTVDLVTQVRPGVYEVIDWKTGECKNWGNDKEKHYEDFCVDPQLRIYHWALSKLYPDIKTLIMTINYVRTKGPYTVAYDESDMADTMKMVRHRFETIKRTTRPKMKSPSNKHWFCKYVCWYGSVKNPAHKDGCPTTCQRIAEKLKKEGMDSVVREETEPGHHIGYYHDPGS